ncbi:hypothetical protein A6U87_17565 [Rhizobium sp. AC44/96]|uniref:KTSC domain-containing protein n=1 Tax=Rhizobium sp. AC44/96 TaxID=1841654 RepID=UPI0008100743|nr:KTSC domain-containing protein [Rhizobium sp. AC44/96]OCJ03743.1 hypothetical protein A6U87_17565 [Rhizobium sp. AC44/96]
MVILRSSAIRQVEYNSASSTLSIWFVESGGPYDYYGVPQRIYEGLIRARSAGTFFNDYIRDHYKSNR